VSLRDTYLNFHMMLNKAFEVFIRLWKIEVISSMTYITWRGMQDTLTKRDN